jgi:WD40 repeat protein
VLASERVGPISDLEISPDGSVIAAAYWAADFAFLDATNLTRKGSARFRRKSITSPSRHETKSSPPQDPDHVALWSFTLPSPSLVWTQAFSDVTGLAFAPDGDTFAFATKDQRIFIYDATTRTMRKTMARAVNRLKSCSTPMARVWRCRIGMAPWGFMILRPARKSPR